MAITDNIFEQIKKINEYGKEYWSARDLYKLLGYTEYGQFMLRNINNHFNHIAKEFFG